jgi:rubrerythrin
MKSIQSPAELYAHAIAIEREAAERYSELAERMDDEGREELTRVFAELARMEAEHLETLERRTAGLALPRIADGEYRWLSERAPETAPRELMFRLMTPRSALAMALAAERRAQAFFEQLCWSAQDPALRALAREMAAEEREHVALIAGLFESTPAPLDTALVFERE